MELNVIITPLHQAVLNGSLSEMTSLLDNGTLPDVHRATWQAYKTRDTRVVYIGECFRSVRPIYDYFEPPINRFTALPVEIHNANNLIFHLTLEMTPLFLTVMLDFKPGFELLLERGADVNKKEVNGNTPLHYAALSGNLIKELLDTGANVNVTNEGHQTPIYFAVRSESRHALELLLKKGARIDTKDSHGNTLLHIAVRKAFNYGMELLLERGIKVNERNLTQEQTPIFVTALRGNAHMFRLLLKKGASVNVKDVYDRTPADWNPKVVYWLEELERLKVVKFGHWSLYDVFSLSPNYGDPVMVANEEMAAVIYSSSFETEFPHYAPSLRKYFVQAEERYKTMNEAQQYLSQFLPKEIQRMILSYLSNEDLTNYRRANIGKRTTTFLFRSWEQVSHSGSV